MNAGSEQLAQDQVLVVGRQSNPANQIGSIHEWKPECPEPFG